MSRHVPLQQHRDNTLSGATLVASARGMCALVLLVLLAVAAGRTAALAHGGDDHSHESEQASDTRLGPRFVAETDSFGVVGIPTAKGGGKIVFYLSDTATNAPIVDAEMDVTVDDQTSKAMLVNQTYEIPAPFVLTPGAYDLTLDIKGKTASDLLIGTLAIPARPPPEERHDSIFDHLALDIHELPEVPLWSLIAALALAGLAAAMAGFTHGNLRRMAVGLATLLATSGVAMAAVMVIAPHAHDHDGERSTAFLDAPDGARRNEDGSIFLPKVAQRLFDINTRRMVEAQTSQKSIRLIGQVSADPNRSAVVQSLLSGRLEAPEGGFPLMGRAVKAGEILAYIVPKVEVVDQSDIRQTIGDLDRQIDLARAQLERFEQLPKGVIAQSRIIDSRIELAALKKRRAEINPVLGERQALVAPVAGVIAEAHAVLGQVVEAQTLLFQIVDPNYLWIEALAFEPQTAADIEASNSGSTAVTVDGRRMPLTFAGRGLALRQQAIPLRFRVATPQKGLSVGQPVTVHASVKATVTAVPVARSSVVRATNNQSIVWVQSEQERFEPRGVVSEVIDAETLGVTAGLKGGERVVIRGAELINQIR